VRGDIGRIGSAARKMMRLLDDLVELSRVGRVANTAVEVSLGDIVSDALELVAGPLAERGVEVDVAPEFPVVCGDKVRLVQVVQNLLENAVKYMGARRDPHVEIGVRPDPDYVVCFVRDAAYLQLVRKARSPFRGNRNRSRAGQANSRISPR
jgi:signal transduction histidine kinase